MKMLMSALLTAIAAVCLSARPVPQGCSSCSFTDFGIYEFSGGACDNDPGRVVDCSGVTCQVNNPATGQCNMTGTVSVTRCSRSGSVDACVIIQDNWASNATQSDQVPAYFTATNSNGGPFYCSPGVYAIAVEFSKVWTPGSPGTCSNGVSFDNAAWLGTYTCN